MRKISSILLILALAVATALAQIPALPEPGLAMYGSVSNTSAGALINPATVNWTVTGNNSTSSVAATIVAVNNQYFYIARIPFETRHLGSSTFLGTSNFLAFNPSGSTYSRSATVNGSAATITASSRGRLASFPFGASDRGTVERVDLTVNLATESFAQWSLRFFGTTNVNPNADADGDGMTNYQEYLAGTDPTDPHSLLTLTSVRPDPQSGVVITWQSAPNKSYSILRSTALNHGFAPLQTHIAATVPTNSFRDYTATGPGPYFYRILLETN